MPETEAIDLPEEDIEGLSPFLAAVRAPIDEDEPAGGSITYDGEFREVKRQIDAISSPGETADFETVAELSRNILREKSKDLRAASYLVIGEARTRGAEGMAEAIRAVRLLIDTYWEEMYPALGRMRGRGSALQVISDRLSGWVKDTEFDASDRDALVEAHSDLKAIQAFSLKEMGEHAPALSGLVNAMEAAIDKLPEPEPEPVEEPEPGETDANAAEPEDELEEAEPEKITETPSEGTTEETGPAVAGEVRSESAATNAVVKAASHLRNQDLTDPVPYRLLRAIRWGALRSEPPGDGGATRIQPPREQRRSYLSGLLEQEKYENLVREAESAFQSSPFHFWIDLQRLVTSALDALGNPYEDARSAVLHDVALLARRLPRLLTLSFRDGTPFASPLTQEWIESQVLPQASGEEASSGGEERRDGSMPVMEQYEEAREKLTGGTLGEALSIMRDGAVQDRSEKEAFTRRLYIATLCLKAGQPSVARPLLDELADGIERHALDAWNPSLALEVWTHQCRCYDALARAASQEATEALFEKADAAFENICRLDAAEAVSVAERRPRSPHE